MCTQWTLVLLDTAQSGSNKAIHRKRMGKLNKGPLGAHAPSKVYSATLIGCNQERGTIFGAYRLQSRAWYYLWGS